MLVLKRIWGSIGALDAWVVYSSGPSEFYYEGDDLSLLHSHGVDNLNNYLTPRAMLSSRVDGTRVNGLIREIKVKQMSL